MTIDLVNCYLVFEYIQRADELGILVMIRLRTLRFRLNLEQGKETTKDEMAEWIDSSKTTHSQKEFKEE